MVQSTIAAAPAPRRRREQTIPAVRPGAVDPRTVYVIVQERDEYDWDGMRLLGDSLTEVGLLQSIGVAELDRAHTPAYLDYMGEQHGVQLDVNDYPADPKGLRRFAVYGCRRTLAAQPIWEYGCDACRRKGLLVKECFASHPLLNRKGLAAQIYHNIDPVLADKLQGIENTYVPPSQEAIARNLERRYVAEQREDPGLTVTEFSRRHNRSAAVVAAAIKFCRLPGEVQTAFKAGTIKYTAAVELSRLQAANCPDDAILFAMQRIVAGRMTTDRAAKFVTSILAARSDAADESLFAEPLDSGRSQVLRRSVYETTHRAFTTEVAALIATHRAIEQGILPVCDPTSDPPTARSLARGTQLRSLLGVS